MLMDLHMHEKRNSADSFISLEEIVFRAREMGLDGICITDHDSMGLVITFHTTSAAMAMESLCIEKGLPGRLIPVPREITAGCGMSFRAEVEQEQALLAAAKDAGIQVDGAYKLWL